MSTILDNIQGPADLKTLDEKELKQLAAEIREFLLENISKTGGHLAPNLGVVELTLALHSHLNSPRDKIVWDVGHQAYTHKILTGRKEQFSQLRCQDGLSGYLKRNESIHDIIEAGHTSTSISSALGLALARDQAGSKERIYAVIGDGALTGGMAFEALNHAGHLQTDLKVVLNDNEMSISPNTGALSRYLDRIRTDPTVGRLQEDVEFLLNKIPRIGPAVNKSVDRLREALTYALISGVLFEEMGFTYIGPLDGHDIEELTSGFERADRIEGPVFIHVRTCKGKGYPPAEKHPDRFHGVGPFHRETGQPKKGTDSLTYSQVFGKTMLEIGHHREDVAGVTAAMPRGTCLQDFADEFPERSYDTGIAEQHAVTLAAGLARGGLQPVFVVYSTFLQRAFDQILHDVCMQGLPVTLAIDRAGIVGRDGETHQGVFDFSYLRMMPGMMIMAPRNGQELRRMLWTAVNHEGPAAVRYPRARIPEEMKRAELEAIFQQEDEIDALLLKPGKAEYLRQGEDVLLLAAGSMVSPCLQAAELLGKKDISAGVVDARFIKPLDEQLLTEIIPEYDWVFTVEEQVLPGGFGSAVLEFINASCEPDLAEVNISRLGLPDEFILQGDRQSVLQKYGLDSTGIVDSVVAVF